jgi:hypothetical protein
MCWTPPDGIMHGAIRWRNASLQGGTSMSVEENMALARRFLEAHFKGDLDAMDEMMTPEFVSHTKLLPDQEPTCEGQKWATAH